MAEQMTPMDALQVTAQVFAKAMGNLADHQTMQQALRVLADLAGKPPTPRADPGSDREDSDE